jgi:hypothetical protein
LKNNPKQQVPFKGCSIRAAFIFSYIYSLINNSNNNLINTYLMKTSGLLLLIFLLLPILSSAGEIYGTIKGDDGKPLVNQVVQIMQIDKVIASATTDANGYFTVTLKEVGKFKLVVVGFKDAGFDVFSSNKSTRYNLLMNKAGERWILKSL